MAALYNDKEEEIMGTTRCIAMILAERQGASLGALTRFYSKPAIPFGGSYRIIDFALNNCSNVGIDTIGILIQHSAPDLQEHINAAYYGNHYMLLPENPKCAYNGMADAVSRNIAFINRFEPINVLVMSGDPISVTDYSEMIAFHEDTNADVTIASKPESMDTDSRFGILHAAEDGRVSAFGTNAPGTDDNLVSMGIYIFKWSALKEYLLADSKYKQMQYEFDKDIIPKMLSCHEAVYTYRLDGYWREIESVEALWKASMDQIDEPGYQIVNNQNIHHLSESPRIISSKEDIRQSIVSWQCTISGRVDHSVLGSWVKIGKGAEVMNSVIMPNAYIGNNVKIYNTVIGTGAIIMDDTVIGAEDGIDYFVDRQVCARDVSLVAPWLYITKDKRFRKNSHIYEEQLDHYANIKDAM